MGGAYRLDAPSLCALLGAPAVGARLRTLQLTYNPLVSGAVVGAISAHCRELSSLALDHCAALDDEALAPLAALRGLTELSLVGLPLLTPDGLVGLLTTPPLDAPASGAAASGAAAAPSQPCAALGARLELLSLAENEQMTDEALIAIAAHCASCLHTLDLSGLHRLTDDGVGACVLQGAALRCVRLRGICALSDEPVRELADRRGAALCELSLNGCAQISNEARARFRPLERAAPHRPLSRVPRLLRAASPSPVARRARARARRPCARSRRNARAASSRSTSRGAAASRTMRSAGWPMRASCEATGAPSTPTGLSTVREAGRCCRRSSCGACRSSAQNSTTAIRSPPV